MSKPNVLEFHKLSMQERVDTCQALLEMDEMQSAGLVEGFGTIDRNRCRQFLSRAKRKGYVPGDGHYAIGKGLLEMAGGRFTQ